MDSGWLPSLQTPSPEAGFELAVKLGRMGVKAAQPSAELREALRRNYEQDSEQLIAVSHVVAVHFQTIAAANNYWR
ncbi:MAG: hexameric tyrosine-coordinated heme protein [Alphaproteobacteria bacterium]